MNDDEDDEEDENYDLIDDKLWKLLIKSKGGGFGREEEGESEVIDASSLGKTDLASALVFDDPGFYMFVLEVGFYDQAISGDILVTLNVWYLNRVIL